MVATLSVDALVAAAARVGVIVTPTDEANNLYVWHTPAREVVYIGKNASGKRLDDEALWRSWNPRDEVMSGFVTLVRANNAARQAFRYDSAQFNVATCVSLMKSVSWSGPGADILMEYLGERPPTAEEVEVLLIRICVRYGVPIGNSSAASQWENPIGKPMDSMAAISVFADDTFRP